MREPMKINNVELTEEEERRLIQFVQILLQIDQRLKKKANEKKKLEEQSSFSTKTMTQEDKVQKRAKSFAYTYFNCGGINKI